MSSIKSQILNTALSTFNVDKFEYLNLGFGGLFFIFFKSTNYQYFSLPKLQELILWLNLYGCQAVRQKVNLLLILGKLWVRRSPDPIPNSELFGEVSSTLTRLCKYTSDAFIENSGEGDFVQIPE